MEIDDLFGYFKLRPKPWHLLVTVKDDEVYFSGMFESKNSAISYLTRLIRESETPLDICRIRIKQLRY